MKRFLAAVAIAAVSLTALAQDDVYIETIEVNVVNLDVFVVNKKGVPVTGLTADDFVVYENGRAQEITNFSEIRETPPLVNAPTISPRPMERIPEERSRKIIFFVDNETVHPFNRNKVFDQIRGFTGELLRPGDQAMLVTWNKGLRIEVPFTSLVSEFEKTLVRVAGENTMHTARLVRRRQAEQGVRGEVEMARDPLTGISPRDAYENSLSIARAYAEEARNEMHAKSVALTGLMSTLAGVEGKKAFIYVGEELPLQPGLELFNYVNEQFTQLMGAGQGSGGIAFRSPETQAPTETLVLEAIGRAANANGVTIYMLNASGGTNLNDSPAERSDPRSIQADFIDTMAGISAFQTVAAKTGGLAFVQTQDIERVFETIERDFGTYYSIGYHASPEAQLGEKRVRVEVKNDDYRVRSRKTFFTKSTHDQVIDGVVANLFYESSRGDLPITLETEPPTDGGMPGRYKVVMRVMIPTEALTMIPVGEKLAGKFSVYLGVGDGKGGISQINTQVQPVQVPLDDIKNMAGKHFTFETALIMRKGENILAVAVLDNVSNLKGFARKNIDVR